MKVFYAGDCAICGFMGPVYFAKVPSSGNIFFVCVLCGVGSKHPPNSQRVESVDPHSLHAPKGFLLPSRDDLKTAGVDHLIVREDELVEEDIQKMFRNWLFRG